MNLVGARGKEIEIVREQPRGKRRAHDQDARGGTKLEGCDRRHGERYNDDVRCDNSAFIFYFNDSNTKDRNTGDADRPENDRCSDRRAIGLPSANVVP